MREAAYPVKRLFPQIPIQYLVGFVFAFFWAATSLNFYYTIEALLALLAVYFFTWRMHEPPIIFFGLALQWVQVSVKVFFANYINADFETLHRFPDHILAAYHSSIFAIIAISAGYYVSTCYVKIPGVRIDIWKYVNNWNGRKLVSVYMIVFLFGNLLLNFSGGLRQLVTAALAFKWSLFFIIYYVYFQTGRNRKVFLALFLMEVITGFTGYFSSYKSAFFVVILAFYAFNYFMSNAKFIAIILLTTTLFFFSVFWQSIKGEYRSYLNDETGAQVVTTTKGDALREMVNLVQGFNIAETANSIEILVNRLSYIDIYSAVIANVPVNRPFEDGRLWFEASLRAFQPRILFPNKTVADDSEKTIMYTGLMFSGAESNTSISMGYIPETYVDFGFKGMMVFLFIFGAAIGLVYWLVLTKSHNQVWGIAFLVPFFFTFNAYEMALDKMVPAIFLYVIAWWLINKYLAAKAEAYFTV